MALTETTPPAAPLLEAEVLDGLEELELAGLLADEPGDMELKLGRVALVPRTTSTCPALTELPACAVRPNSAAIPAAFAFALVPAQLRVGGRVQALRVSQAVGWSILPSDWPSYALGKVTQSSRGIEKPTAFCPPAKMWMRISVFVS